MKPNDILHFILICIRISAQSEHQIMRCESEVTTDYTEQDYTVIHMIKYLIFSTYANNNAMTERDTAKTRQHTN